ncbi:MAG TPA: hypothetical protein VMS89_01350 [Methanoregulaceae archaeon]|nr:hypothetical protein [Methanoregulaceae archaeon]
MMEHETREKAKNAMKRILEAAGFEVSEVDDPLDLSASRGTECVAVLCSNDAERIAEFDRTNYSIVEGDDQVACTKLLFTLDTSISAEHCVIWGVREFVRYSGESTLAGVLDRQLSLTLVPGTGGKTDKSPLPVEPEGQESSGISIPHLPVKISKQQAERISGTQGTANLRFMPHWVYHFMSSGEQVYLDHHIPFDSEGWGSLNAINGMKVEVDNKAIEKSDIPSESEIVQPRISKDDANIRIFDDIVERLTQRIRIKQVKGDTIFYEEKVMKPDKKNISVDIDLVHFPVWQIRGKKIVEVNAFTGDILSEPMDEGVEIL